MSEIDDTDASIGVGHAESPGQSRRDRRRAAGRRDRSTVVSTSGTAVFGASPVTLSAALSRMGQAGAAALIFGTGAREARPASPAAVCPVFITGGSRAERESLGLALAPELVRGGGPSGALEALAQALEASRDALASLGYPEQYWYKTAADEFAALHAATLDESGRGRWMELVDSHAVPIAILDRLFPRCLVIKIVSSGLAPRERAERRAGLRLARRYHEVRAADVKRDASGVHDEILEFITQAAPQA
ncbi:MAG: hypothetical protein QOD57_4158 [Actinomycetota bacterium]|jgi:hypothetical protein|nr:hypothetical protein [Actinomycetota bacterium]